MRQVDRLVTASELTGRVAARSMKLYSLLHVGTTLGSRAEEPAYWCDSRTVVTPRGQA